MNRNNVPTPKNSPSKKDGRLVGIRFDLDDPLEREAYDYLESLRGDYTPRQVVVAALVSAARDGHYPGGSRSMPDSEVIYNAMVDALTRVIGTGQLIVSGDNLAVQQSDGTVKAIMSQEAQTLLGFVDKLGEF